VLDDDKKIKRAVYVSDMFNGLEMTLSKMRYFEIEKEFPNVTKIREKRIFQASSGKFFVL
jgi:hypothetical protein